MAEMIAAAAMEMEKNVQSILSSDFFDPAVIRERKLNLCQAYSLLWQEKETGEVSGRVSCFELLSGAVGAAILDLVALGKLELYIQEKSVLCVQYSKNCLKVIDCSPTNSFLDVALFNKLLKRYNQKPNDPLQLQDVINEAMFKSKNDETCATAALDSMVEIGILSREKKTIGYRFPTLNPAPEENLVKEIRKIALDEAQPDGYMRTLLCLLRAADNIVWFADPLLKRHFSKEEYKLAKARIKRLAALNVDGPAK